MNPGKGMTLRVTAIRLCLLVFVVVCGRENFAQTPVTLPADQQMTTKWRTPPDRQTLLRHTRNIDRTEVSKALRTVYPPFSYPESETESLADEGLLLANEEWFRPFTIWRLILGATIKARFVKVDGEKVVLEKPNNEVVTLPLTSFSTKSNNDLQSYRRFGVPAWAREPTRGVVDRLRNISGGINIFSGKFQYLPPAQIQDDEGRPLLSWRVAILPFIGASELFDLFHLDEPWDSPHNSKLIPKMPSIYMHPLQKDRKSGQTCFVTVRGPNTPFPGGAAVNLRDFKKSTATMLMVVVRNVKSPVTWTRPTDLPIDDGNFGRELDYQDGSTWVVFVENRWSSIAESTSPAAWKKMANVEDD